MRDTQGRKPPKKGPPFDRAALTKIATWLGHKSPPLITLQEWADRVNRDWRTKQAHAKVGGLLAIIKRIVPHGQWGRLFKGHPQAIARPLRMSDRTAERLLHLARHPTVRNPTHGSNLPFSWRTLEKLAQLDPVLLEALLARGDIHPKLTRGQVSRLITRLRVQLAREQGQPVTATLLHAAQRAHRCRCPLCGHVHKTRIDD